MIEHPKPKRPDECERDATKILLPTKMQARSDKSKVRTPSLPNKVHHMVASMLHI
jgi:hypothetical protein